MTGKNVAFALFGGPLIGGAEKRFARLFLHLKMSDKSNRYFLFITRERKDALTMQGIDLPDENVQVFDRTDKRTYFGRKKRITEDCLFLRNCIESNEVDILYSFWQGAFAAYRLRKEGLRFKFILGYNDPSDAYLKKKFLRGNDSYSEVFRYADHVDFLSKGRMSSVLDQGFEFRSATVSPCSFIDYDTIVLKPKKQVVLFAARYDANKNPMLFLEVASRVLKKRNDVTFRMLGRGGEYERKIESFIAERKLDENVKTAYSNRLVDELSESLIFLSLQNDNNYPSQSLIEAMACRNAVIATDRGETANLVVPGAGVLVSENPSEIAEKVEWLLDHPDICRKMGETASGFVRENHTIQKFSEYFAGMLDSVC